MKTSNWLTDATNKLNAAGIATARLDCLILLEDATEKDRAWLLAHSEFPIDGTAINKLNAWIRRRASHEPLAYIRGKSEFYGREFSVNTHTLEPRPETETMIELLKKLVISHQSSVISQKTGDGRPETGDNNLLIVDVGTGSGCLAITAKLEFPSATVYATDIDKKCVETARQNAQKLGADIRFYTGNLLEPLPLVHTTHYILLCNLPYVPDGHTINQAAMFEPSHAIFGGLDGLDLYRHLFEQIIKISHKPRHVLTESLPFQHHQMIEIAELSGYKLQKSDDFIQYFVPDPQSLF